MGARLEIAGWRASGLRCPDHELSFLLDDGEVVYPVSLVQMPNGTGKTTTLELLRAALSGTAADGAWDSDHVRALKKKGGGSSEGQFQVTLLLDGRRISISMDFDFEDGTVGYSTTLGSGMKLGFHPPPQVEPFLKPEFVNFFVFDGELADHLISREHTDAERAIDDLFQLRNFRLIEGRVEEYWNRKVEGRTATEEKGLSRRQNKVKRLRKRIKALEARRAGLEDEHRETQTKLQEMEAQFAEALGKQEEQQDRLLRAQHELGEGQEHVRSVVAEVVAAIKNPCTMSQVIGRRISNLKDSLDQAKLPESAAREFFTELSHQDVCVCGRPLDEESRAAVRERAEQYLGSDDVALLNAMKSQIADQVEPYPARAEERLADLVRSLRTAVSEVGRLRTLRDAIEQEAATGDPRLEAVQQEISRLRVLEREQDFMLRRFEDPTDTARDQDTEGIAVLRRRLTEAEDKLAEISDTLELKEKRDILVRVLEQAHDAARVALSREICRRANQRIMDLMPGNEIRIARVDRCLLLEGQDSGSTGENLSVAYAFLATLFGRAEHHLPFVVDSPANPIDLRVRGKIAALIPRLADQFIAFTISSERQGFLDPLEQTVGDRLQFITLFRKGTPELDRLASQARTARQSADGVVVRGREFFRAFHLDEEA